MKRIVLSAVIAAALALNCACTKFDVPSNPYTPATEEEAPSKYVPFEAEYINVPQGCTSLVYLDGELIASCYQSGYVVLPKTGSTKALSDCQIVTIPGEAVPGVASENKVEMVVAFEDRKDGDHDYNDLVIQARMVITNAASGSSTVDIDLTPIAMGGSMTLGLGVLLTDADGNLLAEEKIAENCRTELFDDHSDPMEFINATGNRRHYDSIPVRITTAGNAPVTGISWYLEVEGEKLFAANKFQPCLDDEEKPQGLVLTKIRSNGVYFEKDGNKKYLCGHDFWQYPRERIPIDEVYPGFAQAFLEGGDFSVFANPVQSSGFFDAIAAEEDGCLTSDTLYNVYREDCDCIVDGEGGGETPISAVMYYDNTGRATATEQSFEAEFNSYNHAKDNFILEFSTARGNAIDFSRGDRIEAKITDCVDFPFDIGDVNTDAPGKTLEGYTNGAHSWWRVQDAFNHSAKESGKIFPGPLVVRISLEGGIEFFVNDQFEQRLPSSNEILASILQRGTDTPLYFGLFGPDNETIKYCAKATYEYLRIIRNCDPDPIESVSVTPSAKTIVVGETATLQASVNPVGVNQAVSWSSSDASVASVDPSSGLITGISAGTCTITATSTGDTSKSDSCALTVNNVPITGVTLEDKAIVVGQTVTLTASVLPANATNKAVTWSSSNPSVASVNASTGELTGVAMGSCTVTATSVETPSVSGTCTIAVNDPAGDVMIWSNLSTNTTSLDQKTLEIIASGTPSATQICFNNGDYIEAKITKKEVASSDRDIIYVGSQASGVTPNMVLIGHPIKYTEIYMIPSSWWSVAKVPGMDVDVPMYVRFGCKADGKRGCGSWSADGINWTTFTNLTNSNDIESQWQTMISPERSPLIIQTARTKGSLQLSVYDYVKIVRNGASE